VAEGLAVYDLVDGKAVAADAAAPGMGGDDDGN
jgi:hypothetical protein